MNRRGPAIFSAIVVGVLLLVRVWAWIQLPADAQVPIHWGANAILIGGIAVLLVFMFAYSYRVWKTDPAKRTA